MTAPRYPIKEPPEGHHPGASYSNILLYMTMWFTKLIKKIQGLEAYHSSDKLIVEVDIVLNKKTSFWDSHDLGESL